MPSKIVLKKISCPIKDKATNISEFLYFEFNDSLSCSIFSKFNVILLITLIRLPTSCK